MRRLHLPHHLHVRRMGTLLERLELLDLIGGELELLLVLERGRGALLRGLHHRAVLHHRHHAHHPTHPAGLLRVEHTGGSDPTDQDEDECEYSKDLAIHRVPFDA